MSRIIPARAGFTAKTPENQPKTTDHPRTRGVYLADQALDTTSQGSSPHARGLLAGLPYRVGKDRIIPARAGFTLG